MNQLLIASTNQGKIVEIQTLFADLNFQILTPKDINLDPNFDVEETGTTFQDNATLKAKAFASKTNLLSLADDSGLIVDALNGEPGVYSKRYGTTDHNRNLKIITALSHVTNPSDRTARFVSVIAVHDPTTNTTLTSEGRVEGTIATSLRGTQGFGYDPVFIPSEGDGRTFAELGTEFKNTVSHRFRALTKIKTLLQQRA